ncbi:MAG: hypothetical protein OXD44_02790 [Gammaproteobacteria bacterium]|nr:hypothetical protein [Gammaproteobacteria bacterium]
MLRCRGWNPLFYALHHGVFLLRNRRGAGFCGMQPWAAVPGCREREDASA